MRSRISVLIVVLAVSGTVPPIAAAPLPDPGTRIRLTARTPQRERWIGPFVSVAHDTVRMQDGGPEGALVAVPAMHVELFEVSRGVQTRMWRGAFLGLAIGAALGAVGGYYLAEDSIYGPGAGASAGAIVVGLLGAVVGASQAGKSPSEQWHELPLEQLKATPGP